MKSFFNLLSFLPPEKLSFASTSIISSNPKGVGVWNLHPFSHTCLSCPIQVVPKSCIFYAESSYLQPPLWLLPSSHPGHLSYYMAEAHKALTTLPALGQEAISASRLLHLTRLSLHWRTQPSLVLL